jgi:ferritin-like metal-binding protein YciE
MAPKKSTKVLQDLFLETLKDIYYAEKKLTKALPKLAKAAQSRDLQKAFQKHAKETENHVVRLEKVFKTLDRKPAGKVCPAINGLVEEGQEIMKEFKGSPAHDAGLLAAAQAVEHYEMSRYGTLAAWAAELEWKEAQSLLEATLSEEKETDSALTKLAESDINQRAEKTPAKEPERKGLMASLLG